MMTLLTPAEAQKEYHLGRDFVRRLIRDRKIPVVPLGPRKVLLPRDGLEAFLQRNTIPARREYFKSHNPHP
jgi:excisionase family DNA binding protein